MKSDISNQKNFFAITLPALALLFTLLTGAGSKNDALRVPPVSITEAITNTQLSQLLKIPGSSVSLFIYVVKESEKKEKKDFHLLVAYLDSLGHPHTLGKSWNKKILENGMTMYAQFLKNNGFNNSNATLSYQMQVKKSVITKSASLLITVQPLIKKNNFSCEVIHPLKQMKSPNRSSVKMDSIGGCKYPPGCMIIMPYDTAITKILAATFNK